ATRVAVWRQVDMHFRARPTRTRVAHHPEIVGLAAAENMNFWLEIGFTKQTGPVIVRFLVELTRLAGAGLINRRVKALRRKFPAVPEEIPRPLDCFLFEIIAEAPVAEHLEKRVMISVEPDIFEIVMFSSGPGAFLRVGNARWLPLRFLLPEKNRHELVHACIGKQKIRRVGQKRRRGHNGVLFLVEEIEK